MTVPVSFAPDPRSRCPPPAKNGTASNLLSVVFQPAAHTVYAAWEHGGPPTNMLWSPACCGAYAEIDLSKWFFN